MAFVIQLAGGNGQKKNFDGGIPMSESKQEKQDKHEPAAIPVGVDDGFREVKASPAKGGELSFASLVRPGFVMTSIGDDAGLGGYETNGRQFTVDPAIDGEDTRFADFALSDINRVLVNHALHKAGMSGKQVILATGLPYQSFFQPGTNQPNQELIDKKIQSLEMAVSSLDGAPAPIIVRQHVTAQGLAAYVDYMTDDNGNVPKGVDIDASIAVIDVGGRTTDCVTVYGGGKLDHAASGTGDIGISNMFDIVHNELCREFNVSKISLNSLSSVVRTRKIRLRAQTHDVGPLIDRAVNEIGDQILREIKRKIGEGAELEKILLVGGGAALMESLVKQAYPHCVVPAGPEYANARGMRKYVQYLAE